MEMDGHLPWGAMRANMSRLVSLHSLFLPYAAHFLSSPSLSPSSSFKLTVAVAVLAALRSLVLPQSLFCSVFAPDINYLHSLIAIYRYHYTLIISLRVAVGGIGYSTDYRTLQQRGQTVLSIPYYIIIYLYRLALAVNREQFVR